MSPVRHVLADRNVADILQPRTLIGLLWSCLTTIFACTWVSVHPNLPRPGPTQRWLNPNWRRIRMMVIAIIAPELIVFCAARQFFFARAFSKEFGVSKHHGFFFAMGGFVSRGSLHPITTLKQLEDPLMGAQYLADIRATDSEEILDKSKGDALSKGFALLQSSWFIAQCLARISAHLPLSALEVTTLAFSAVNIIIRIIWWGKPVDVQTAIPIGPSPSGDPCTAMVARIPSQRRSILESMTGAIYGGTDYDPATSHEVPALWCPPAPAIQNFMRAFFLETLVAIIFGTIHCAAWHAPFPSAPEAWAWRLASAAVTLIPTLIGLAQLWRPRAAHPAQLEVVFFGTLLGYIVSRLVLIILPFTTLRALPAQSLVEIEWITYIPHI
ncbi:hypothetical protein FB451DRAFT_1091624 [Mycena latifolia]|nr:hypothetical protein FB451DRAFT_1091624 [Mycena latifolia]